jgi:hypothetical protein
MVAEIESVMTAANQEIITCYETLGLSPDAIAAEYGYELESIKAVLLSFSKLYREREKLVKAEANQVKEDISEGEYEEILSAYKTLALTSDNDHVRERALRNLIDEKKGRNNPRNLVKNDRTINVIVFNQNLIKARQAKERALSEGSIEVESKVA